MTEERVKKRPALILIADGSHARLISCTPRSNTVLWTMASRAATKRTEALVTDRAGRVLDGRGRSRHALEPRTSPHRLAQLAFARKVAGAVEKSLATTNFGKFVLVAPARALGDLRRQLPDDIKGSVTDELRKDLAALPDSDVLVHLADSDIML